MSIPAIHIHQDIRCAATLPAFVYSDPHCHDVIRELVFAKSWQWLGHESEVSDPGCVLPLILLEGCLDEPLLLSRDAGGQLRCLSNVCTHRGNLVVEKADCLKSLRCRYHGRKFDLDGKFQSMPEFEETRDFPSPADDLAQVELATWSKLLFANFRAPCKFETWLEPVRQRVGWMPIDEFRLDSKQSRIYEVEVNWALYCDNYLEGFHIPFVHDRSLKGLDYGNYRTELFEFGSLQIGVGKNNDICFDLPEDSPDYGDRIAAYYFWLFPNLMLNFYPWGLSLNHVRPKGVAHTEIEFRSFVWKDENRSKGAGSALHKVELEDEEIILQVQKGVRSRLYQTGRYSPRRELGVHHFHRLLAHFLNS